MRVGFFSDIHGNLRALEAVLNEVHTLDAAVCCGDVVGYYNNPEDCVQLLRSSGIPTVIGNHDQFALGRLSFDASRDELYRASWTRDALSTDSLEWLASLPVEINRQLEEWHVTIRHASPWDVTTYLYPDSPRLQEVELPPHHCLVIGHTHRRFVQKRGEGLLINAGSVGQPRTGNPGAGLAIFDTRSGEVEFGTIAYDIPALQEELKALHWPEILIRKVADPEAKDSAG